MKYNECIRNYKEVINLAKEKFVPTIRYKRVKGKKDEYELDEKGNKIPLTPFQSVTKEDVIEFLKKNGTPEDIAEFKKDVKTRVIYEKTVETKSGKKRKVNRIGTEIVEDKDFSNWAYAKRKFCEKFAPSIVPHKEAKEKTLLELLEEL